MERSIPGKIPAAKSLPMDCSVSIPYTIKITLGGIRIPRLPAAATVPVARLISYLYRFISGRVTVAIVAAVAFVEPDMAEKPAHAATVAIASPPRRCPTSTYAAS